MKRLFDIVLVLPLGLLIAVLAVTNRHPVRLSLNPFEPVDPAFAIMVPLFWVIFAALAIGVLLGGSAVWLRQGRFRREARKRRKDMAQLTRALKANAPKPVGSLNSPSAAALPTHPMPKA